MLETLNNYSSTNIESHHGHKFTLCYQDHLSFICLVSEGHFKRCRRGMCENTGAFRWPVRGKNVLMLGHILSPEMKEEVNRIDLLL